MFRRKPNTKEALPESLCPASPLAGTNPTSTIHLSSKEPAKLREYYIQLTEDLTVMLLLSAFAAGVRPGAPRGVIGTAAPDRSLPGVIIDLIGSLVVGHRHNLSLLVVLKTR